MRALIAAVPDPTGVGAFPLEKLTSTALAVIIILVIFAFVGRKLIELAEKMSDKPKEKD